MTKPYENKVVLLLGKGGTPAIPLDLPILYQFTIIPAGTRRWINVDPTLMSDVGSTSGNQRQGDVENLTLCQRQAINVGVTLNLRWLTSQRNTTIIQSQADVSVPAGI